jgi:hypothetical protein
MTIYDVNLPSKSNKQKTFRIGFEETGPDPAIYFTTAPDPDLAPYPLEVKMSNFFSLFQISIFFTYFGKFYNNTIVKT